MAFWIRSAQHWVALHRASRRVMGLPQHSGVLVRAESADAVIFSACHVLHLLLPLLVSLLSNHKTGFAYAMLHTNGHLVAFPLDAIFPLPLFLESRAKESFPSFCQMLLAIPA